MANDPLVGRFFGLLEEQWTKATEAQDMPPPLNTVPGPTSADPSLRRRLVLASSLWALSACGDRADRWRQGTAEGGLSGGAGAVASVGRGRDRGNTGDASTPTLSDLAYGPDSRHRLDVYTPPSASNAPIILFAHGGAWVVGDKSMGRGVDNKVARWVSRGAIVIAMNYRMPKPPNPGQQAEDVARALAFVQTHARTWGGSTERIMLMGHSAGAHLASLVSADVALQQRWNLKPWLGTVSLDSAAMDVVTLMQNKHPRLYDRVFGNQADGWKKVSPLHQITGKLPPMLLVCSAERSDSCDAARAFAQASLRFGSDVKVLPVALNHGAINTDLGQAGPYTDAVEAFMFPRLGLAR